MEEKVYMFLVLIKAVTRRARGKPRDEISLLLGKSGLAGGEEASRRIRRGAGGGPLTGETLVPETAQAWHILAHFQSPEISAQKMSARKYVVRAPRVQIWRLDAGYRELLQTNDDAAGRGSGFGSGK